MYSLENIRVCQRSIVGFYCRSPVIFDVCVLSVKPPAEKDKLNFGRN